MTRPDDRLRVAIAQDQIAPDGASGLARTEQRAAEAARAGAALVVFPETWLPASELEPWHEEQAARWWSERGAASFDAKEVSAV